MSEHSGYHFVGDNFKCIISMVSPLPIEFGRIKGMGLSVCAMCIHLSVSPSHFCGFHAFMEKLLRGLITNLVDTSTLSKFWSCFIEFPLLPGIWLIEQFPCIFWQTALGPHLRLGWYIHYDTLPTWLTFGQTLLNSHCFLASDLSSSFYAFADKPLIGLSSDWESNSLQKYECFCSECCIVECGTGALWDLWDWSHSQCYFSQQWFMDPWEYRQYWPMQAGQNILEDVWQHEANLIPCLFPWKWGWITGGILFPALSERKKMGVWKSSSVSSFFRHSFICPTPCGCHDLPTHWTDSLHIKFIFHIMCHMKSSLVVNIIDSSPGCRCTQFFHSQGWGYSSGLLLWSGFDVDFCWFTSTLGHSFSLWCLCFRQEWENLLKYVHCEIISEKEDGDMKAFVLR